MASKWVNLSDKERDEILASLPKGRLYDKIANLNKRITIASAKGKGRSLQYWVCEQISKFTGIPYKQGDDECLIQSRPMGISGNDVILRGEAKKVFPFSIECKSSEGLDLVGTIEQAKSNTSPGTNWLIVHKRKAIAKPIVILEWDAFVEALGGNKKRTKKGD